jgi:voltage-gated potassium channel
MRRRLSRLFDSPLIRRIQFYARRARGQLDRRFFVTLIEGILVIVVIAAVLITLLEKDWTLGAFGTSFYWGLTTVLGQGDPSYITSPAGWFISWLLILFGVALFGTITGALIAIVIDFLLKEGQGMGASGYVGHVVVCGWNTTARDLIAELTSDDYKVKVVVIAPLDKNPAGAGVYFVKGDPTEPQDLERAGIENASAALIFPVDDSNDADMRSILTVIAIESMAPAVRTVAEVNNPRHADHFRRARVDELLVSSQVGARLLARSALYPGLTELVADIVSGGEGSELYRVQIPDDYLNLSVDDVSIRLRADHRATLLSISRGGRAFVNPPSDFRIEPGDDAVVVAESLGTLAPLILKHDDGTGTPATPMAVEADGNGSGPTAERATPPPTDRIVPVAAAAAAVQAVASGPAPAPGPAQPTGVPGSGPTQAPVIVSSPAPAPAPPTITAAPTVAPVVPPTSPGGAQGPTVAVADAPVVAAGDSIANGAAPVAVASAPATAVVSGVAVLDPATLAAIQAVAQAQAAPPVQYVAVAAYPDSAPQVIPVAPLPAASAEPDGKRGKHKKKHGKG